ncbi:MAG: hypothetical protein FJ100_14450 [Deltaproteobacteria bacterium]|nr:hypothetical protein [Deltaproteobacteria bacterium]
MATELRHQCYKCQEELVFDVKIARLDTCPNCSAYLHSCRNCRFWSPNAHNQCTENQGEFIRDREAANFCNWFAFRVMGEDNSAEIDATKARLDALFGGGGGAAKPAAATPLSPKTDSDARARLEALFKK